MRMCRARMMVAMTGAFVLGVVSANAVGRDVRLVLHPLKTSAEAADCSLLPPAAVLTDGDAAALYFQAVETLPSDADFDRIVRWLAVPIEQLPLPEVRGVLELYRESLMGVTQAARCRECKWPQPTLDAAPADSAAYRRLGYAVWLHARYETACGDYEGAIRAMQTGSAMARHLTQAPTLAQFLVGVWLAGLLCEEVEVFVQADGAPSLQTALMALPHPFADAERAIETDANTASSKWAGLLTDEQITQIFAGAEVQASHRCVRVLANCLEHNLAALQCVEAIRWYAASHRGQLPQTLAAITDFGVRKDSTRGEAFRYLRSGATAALESPAPAGGEKTDELRYQIVVKD
jgi:hypothetical protein